MEEGSQIGHFRIDRLLGQGGMGEVYLATDLKLNRLIALKLLRKEISENKTGYSRFRREAQSASALSHPNICNVYDIGESNGRMYIAMEYVEGTSLLERIRAGPIETPEAIEIGIQIADALEEARKKNIVHRDIKSSNIMLTPRNRVKLLDFGLAKTISPSSGLSRESTETRITESGTLMGTVSYMSPEQALGHPVDHRSDVFSFGVVLYEMLTARLPFSGHTQTEIIDALLHKDPPAVSRFNETLPDALVRVIQKMLRKNVDERYQSVHEVWSDLRHIRDEGAAVLKDPQPPVASLKKKFIAAAIIGLITIASIFIFSVNNQETAVNLSGISSIVALPCKVYGASDVTYLTDAVPSTLSTLLGQIDGLETKMPPSSVEVDQVNGDLNKIADAYRVNAFLTSSITAVGDHLTINLQLIEPRTRRVLWANQYEGTRGSYNEMTRQAANGIRKVLRPIATTITSSDNMASTSEAELAFRQGLHYSYRYNRQNNAAYFEAALKSFNRTLDLDPKFADAAAEIAWLYGMKSEIDDQPDQMIMEANRWSWKALTINNRCSKAWSGLYGSDFTESLEYALRGVKYGPKDSYAHNTLGMALNAASIKLTLSAYQTASSLDPLYLQPAINVAGLLKDLGRYEEALSKIDALQRLEPNFGIWPKSFLLAELDRREELLKLVPDLERLKAEGKLSSWRLEFTQYVIAETENREEDAQTLLNQIKLNFTSRSDIYFWLVAHNHLIPFLIRQGKIEEALFALNNELEFSHTAPYEFFLQNPHYKKIRYKPRMKEYISRSRGKLKTTISLLEKAKQRGELPPYLEEPLSELRTQMAINSSN